MSSLGYLFRVDHLPESGKDATSAASAFPGQMLGRGLNN
jgi:hypothetical protein